MNHISTSPTPEWLRSTLFGASALVVNHFLSTNNRTRYKVLFLWYFPNTAPMRPSPSSIPLLIPTCAFCLFHKITRLSQFTIEHTTGDCGLAIYRVSNRPWMHKVHRVINQISVLETHRPGEILDVKQDYSLIIRFCPISLTT